MPYKDKEDSNRNARERHATGRYYDNKRNGQLKLLYGITLDDYNKMFFEQNGCCAICNKHQNDLSKKLNVDHDHKSGKVRKLLCASCNMTLGRLENNLDGFLDYLMEFENENG